MCLNCEDMARQIVQWCAHGEFLAIFLHPAFPASRVHHISDLHSKFALCPQSTPTLVLLLPPYGIGQAIIFSSCGFFILSIFLSVFPRSFPAVAEWMCTLHPHMVLALATTELI